MHGVGTTVSFQHLQLWSGLAEDSFCLGRDSGNINCVFDYSFNYGVCQMTTFKEAQIIIGIDPDLEKSGVAILGNDLQLKI